MNRPAFLRLVLAAFGAVLIAGCQSPNSANSAAAASTSAPLASATSAPSSDSGQAQARVVMASSTSPTPQATVASARAAASAAAQGRGCSATVSNAHPVRNSSVDVLVTTAANAAVSAVAHYKTTTTQHAAAADATGHADVRLTISKATVGFRVLIDVTVGAGGPDNNCQTSFTPVAVPISAAPSTPGLPPIQVTTEPLPPLNNPNG